MMPLLPFYITVLGSFLLDNINYHLNCTLSDMWARYGSNKFTQMPFIIVPHVSITLVSGSPFQLCKHGLVGDVSQYQKDF